MKRTVVATLVLLAAVTQAPVAAGQTVPPGPPVPPIPGQPTDPNQRGMPWFTRPPGTPGMPWFFRPPAAARPRQCRVAYWYPAQFWHTDQWGHAVTWVGYAPHYVCG